MKMSATEEWRVLRPEAPPERTDDQTAVWQPFIKRHTVNIACMSGTSSDEILREVEVVRQRRIGFDAHFPSIVLWMNSAVAIPFYFEALARLDTSTPRLRTVIPCIGLENIAEACTAVFECKSRNIESQILCILHSNCFLTLEPIIIRLRKDGLLSNAWFEWLFTSQSTKEWWQCCNLIEDLDSTGYSFSKQELSICGGIASLVRNCIMAEFKPSETTQPDRLQRAAHRGSSPSYTCASTTIQTLINSVSGSLKCTCQVPIPPVGAIEKVGRIIDRRMLLSDNDILFEDWQYIYDGFETS